uniref:Carboxylic ester hydrolase n=1 Tax=Caenorhabditis elegans TaxID=6239 RepID=O61459_CAEEL|nr:acetylcholinesterase [Caenorhabditis elegans]
MRRRRVLLLLLSTTTFLRVSTAQQDEPKASVVEVQTKLGTVRGTESDHGNKRVRSYLEVPFAEPPINEHRFKKPTPARPWNGTISANTLSPACFQGRDSYDPTFWGSEMWNANTPVSEDCLYVNIWAPADAYNLTVLVWLFGGGFWYGSPSLLLYDGKELATRGNVIVVNINYRVGPFGYLFLDQEDVPGNMGMLDQQLALYWIRDHIFSFGGNPARISLVGESAGAASIVAHLIAPASKGLFQNGILQSGSLDNKWSMDSPKRAKQKSTALADLVGCNQTKITDQTACLRNTPAQLLIDNIWNVGLNFLEFPFAIVSKDQNFFKHLDGFIALREGTYSTDVNLMFGINHDEGNFWNIYNLAKFFDKQSVKPGLDRDEFHECVDTAFAVQPELVRTAAKYVYSDPKCTDPKKKTDFYTEQVNQMVGDYFFTCDSIWFAHNYPKMAGNQSNVFVYYFDQPSSANPWPKWTGVMHGYEIEYVFGVPLHNTTAGYTKEEMDVSEKVIDFWTTFANTGVPSLRKRAVGTTQKIKWDRYDGTDHTTWMNIKTGSFRMIQEIKKVECDLWRNAKDMEYSAYKEELATTSSSTLTQYTIYLILLSAFQLVFNFF